MIHETVLLGCCIVDPACLDKALQASVTAEHFQNDDRALLWKTFVELRATGKGLDIESVAIQLGKNCPFTEYSELTNVATTLNFQEALDSLLWAYKSIRLRTEAQVLLSRLNASESPELALGSVSRLQDIATASGSSNAADLDAATATVEAAFQDALDGKPDTRRKFPMPLPAFDRILGPIHDNEFVMVAARPSVGKTSFVVQMTTECVRAGYNVAFIPTEVTAEDIIRQIASQVAQVNLQQLDRELPERLKKAKEVAKKVRETKKLRIFDKSTELTEIWNCCRLVKDWADIVVIDQLAQIRNPGGSRYESVTDTCSALVAIKKMLGKPLIVAHQLKRLQQGNPPPSLADLKDSGAAEQDASRVLLIHYPDENHMGIPQVGLNIDPPDTRDYFLIQAKHRFGVRDVSVKCKYHAPTTRFC
jgi:replicative DNA helicase